MINSFLYIVIISLISLKNMILLPILIFLNALIRIMI